MKKNIFIILLSLIISNIQTFANTEVIPVASPAVVPYTSYTRCIPAFPVSSEKLYYLTLAAINTNNYIPVEAQTRAGYILFSAGKKEFLATIAKAQDNISVIKITPANNSYYFPEELITSIFYTIANTLQTEIVTINQEPK